MEAAFPKESVLVMVADFTDGEQVDNFNTLIAAFPTTGFGKLFSSGFNEAFDNNKAEVSWSKDVAPIFKGKWKAGMAMDESSFNPGEKNPKIYLVAELSESEALKNFLNKLMKNGTGSWKDIKYEKNDGVEYWTNDFSKIYLALDGHVFVVAVSEAERKAAIERLEGGGGFSPDDSRKVMNQDGFFYYYLTLGGLKGVLAESFGGGYLKLIETFDNGGVVISARRGGFMMEGATNLMGFDSGKIEWKDFYVNPDYKLSLLNKVNSKGLFYYTEASSLKAGIFNFLFYGNDIAPVVKTDNGIYTYLRDLKLEAQPFLQKFDVLLRSPYALSISDKESFLPAIALYFQLEPGDVEGAKVLLNDFDGYIAQFGDQLGFLKKDVMAVNGGALHKLYVDWAQVSQKDRNKWSDELGIDVTTLKNELYYGLMGDNVFVLAWYPNFPEEYGQDPLSKNEKYLEAVKKLGDTYGSTVSYISTESFLNFTDRFVQVWKASLSDFQGAEVESVYKLYFRKLVGAVKYIVSSGVFKEKEIGMKAFVRIEKVDSEVP